MSRRLCLHLIAALTLLLVSCSATEPCYHFSFPTAFQSRTINTTEGSTITLPFNIDTSPCPMGWNEPIFVYIFYPQKQSPVRDDFCYVQFQQKTCFSTNSATCACMEGTFGDIGVAFTKTVSKADSGSWLWQTGDGVSIDINFDIRERPTPGSTVRSETKATSQENTDGRGEKATREETTALQETPFTLPPMTNKETRRPSSTDNSMKTGLITGSVNIVIAVTIILVVFLFRRRRRAREVKARCTVNFTPVLEVNEDVLTWAQRHDNPNDVGRSTSYVSFGGTMTWSNENIPQVHRNEGYLATSPSDQSFTANSPMTHP